MNLFKITIKAHEICFSDESWAFWNSTIDNDVKLYSMKIKKQTRNLVASCAEVQWGDIDVVWRDFRSVLIGTRKRQ